VFELRGRLTVERHDRPTVVPLHDIRRTERQHRLDREHHAGAQACAVARLVVPEVTIRAWVSEIGGDAVDEDNFDFAEIGRNPFFCPDAEAALRWEKIVDGARLSGSSVGAVVECEATGVTAGWGAPLYAKLDADLAAAMMGINAVKGVEIGDGFSAARLTGEQNADPMRPGEGMPEFLAKFSPKRFGEGSTFTAVVRYDRVNTNLDYKTGAGDLEQISFGLNYRPIQDTVFKISYQYMPKAFNPNTSERIHDSAVVISAATYF